MNDDLPGDHPPGDHLPGDHLPGDHPPGDHPPEDTASVECPYCGAWVELLLDSGGGPFQRYVEDCEICCRPLDLRVSWDAEGQARVEAFTEDDVG